MSQLDTHMELNTLCQDLGEVEDQIRSLNEERERLRARISELVEELGGRATLHGFGSLQISAPFVMASYDRRGLDQLVADLVAAGHEELAAAIQDHRRESMRTGGLRIVRERDQG